MRNTLAITALVSGLLFIASPALSSTIFNVTLDGSQEVGAGDPSGSAVGTLTLDPDADTVSWNIAYLNLSNPFPVIYPISLVGWRIHGPNGSAGANAAVLINLGDVSTGSIPNSDLMESWRPTVP